VIYSSRYPDPAIPDVSLPGYVLSQAARFGDRAALIDGVTGERLTYSELLAAVGAGVRRLRAAGADTVALIAGNQPAWAVAFYAALSAGARVVPLNPAFTPGEIAKLCGSAGVSLVVADDGALPGAWEARVGQVVRLADLTAAGPDYGGPEPDGGDRTAVIAFSSGTTGLPKGTMLSHRNLVATLCQHEGIYHVDDTDVFAAALPMFHIYGMSIVLGYALRHGATVVTLPRFSLDGYLAAIAEHGVTWLHLAPPLVPRLTGCTDADFSSVRHVVSGAAPLDPALVAAAQERFGCLVGQGYGMTEASPGVTWVPDDGSADCPPGSVGVLVAGTEARIVDPVSGLDTEGPGEMWVRGPQVMSGYLGDPSATAATVTSDGWLRTGDIVRVDDGGAWWVVDRLKELIKYKGFQVAPAELEGLLLEHPAVADAAVTGQPDREAGEIPVAWVVRAGEVTEDELIGWVAARVAPYKKIRAMRFIDEIPRSPAGKILRRQLKHDVRSPWVGTPGPDSPLTQNLAVELVAIVARGFNRERDLDELVQQQA
jgi:acyl-CoA synthetase (AMP-forming)/AMP-acid ligase II